MIKISLDDFRRRFSYVRELPAGYFGRTFIVKDRTTFQLFVGKHMSIEKIPDQRNFEEIITSVQKIASLRLNCIINYTYYMEHPQGLVLVRPYLEGTFISQLSSSPASTDSDSIMYLWRNVVKAYISLHEAGVTPTFIKPSNILITPLREVMLVDVFKIPSLASIVVNSEPHNVAFLAPEFFTNEFSGGSKSDVWSIGAILMFMVKEDLPWNSKNIFALVRNITQSEIEIDDLVPIEFAEVMRKMLVKNPLKRSDLKEIMQLKQKSITDPKHDSNLHHRRGSDAVTRPEFKLSPMQKARTEKVGYLPHVPAVLLEQYKISCRRQNAMACRSCVYTYGSD